MSKRVTLNYRLARAVVVISGTVRRTFDQDVDVGHSPQTVPAKLISHTIELRHDGDPGDPRALEVKGGWLWTYKGSFAFTEDLRLTKASVETGGEIGSLITAGASLAGAVAPALIGALGEVPDPSRRAYELLFPEVAAERERLAKQRDGAREKMNAMSDALVESPERTDELRPRLRQLQEIERAATARMAVLDAQYEAWHATRVVTVDEAFEVVAEIAGLPVAVPGAGAPPGWGGPSSASSPGAPSSLKDLWERYGMTVVARWAAPRSEEAQTPQADTAKLFTRRAEDVTLEVIETPENIPTVTSRSRHFVADRFSPVDGFAMERTLFGRRSLELSFTSDGYLTGIGVEGSAALAELAKVAEGVPASVAAGADAYAKVSANIATARRAGLDAELARVKSEVELRQQKVAAAGLDVTSADAARLERLKQLQAILEAQKAIGGSDPALVTALRETADSDLTWYQPPPPAVKEDQTLTVIVRQAPPDPS